MFYIAGIKMNLNSKVVYALPKIFGIGIKNSEYICNFIGIPSNVKIKTLTEEHQIAILDLIKQKFIIDETLKQQITNNITKLIETQTYRGNCHISLLPVRGQRTHTNRKTQKRIGNLFLPKK